MGRTELQCQLEVVCSELVDFLCDKNDSYGNSIFDPLPVFCDLSPDLRMAVRMDDKISRLAMGDKSKIAENDHRDLLGYLLLREVYRRFYLGEPAAA